jgi:pyruvate/2-oxoglutarate dehydrogenase complex dihydrolipoamide dehydrogenase (E3) component
VSAQQFDVFVIGAGQAAWPLLNGLSGKGMRLALAEKKQFGGSCLNFGCTPSKAVIESARVAHLARRGHEFGIDIESVQPNFPLVMDQARKILAHSVSGLAEGFESMQDLQVFRSHARFLGPTSDGYEIGIGTQTVIARHVVIDSGTRTQVPPIEGLDQISYMDTENWIDRSELPNRLAILGGGYIAVEMSQFFRRMGSEVTVIERAPSLLGHEDQDVSAAIKDVLEGEGIKIHVGKRILSVHPGAAGTEIVWDDGQVVADELLVATGRRANTDELGLEKIGIEVKDNGIIQVDEHLRTSAPGVFAVGDIRGGGMFTSTAWDDGRIVLGVLTDDLSRTTDRVVPYAVFIDPELGRVGLTEREATEQGKRFKVNRFEMAHNGRNQEARETTGFVKLLIESDTDQVLGAAVFGAQAAETSQLLAVLMAAKAPASVIRDGVVTHPTYSEAIQSALLP